MVSRVINVSDLVMSNYQIGHRNLLLKRKILHRDVSINNLMYFSTKRQYNMGKIIDLDLAADVEKLLNRTRYQDL